MMNIIKITGVPLKAGFLDAKKSITSNNLSNKALFFPPVFGIPFETGYQHLGHVTGNAVNSPTLVFMRVVFILL